MLPRKQTFERKLDPEHNFMMRFWRLGYRPGRFDPTIISASGEFRWRRLFWKFYWRQTDEPDAA